MKLLLALLISVFSVSAFAQGAKEFDLSGSKVNLRLCKSIEAEIQSLTKEIIVLSKELEKLRSIKNPSREIVAQIKKLSEKIEELKNRLARLSAFYEKNCKKDVVDCDLLQQQIEHLKKQISKIDKDIIQLSIELRGLKPSDEKYKKVVALLTAKKQQLSNLQSELKKLLDLYKKNC